MQIRITENPLKKKQDETAIYTMHHRMPTPSPLQSFPEIRTHQVSNFVNRLHYNTLDENGFTYYYPDQDKQATICRFEWHFPLDDDPYKLRVGLTFTVSNSRISNPGFYISSHEFYENPNAKPKPIEIEEHIYDTITNDIMTKITSAINGAIKTQMTSFHLLYYMESFSGISEEIKLSEDIMVYPSKKVDQKTVSLILIPVKAPTYLEAKRAADEKANLLCAICSMAMHKPSLITFEGLPHVAIFHSETPSFSGIEDKLYPDRATPIPSVVQAISTDDIYLIRSLDKAFAKLSRQKNAFKATNLLFAFFTALSIESTSRTMSLVGLLSCLEGIAHERFGHARKKQDSIKSLIEMHIVDERSRRNLSKWVKRIYGRSRSGFVHESKFIFDEFSQQANGGWRTGSPKSIPKMNSPFSTAYQDEQDYETLVKITRFILLKHLESKSGCNIPTDPNEQPIDFSLKNIPEAFLSFANQGYMRISGEELSND